MYLLACMLAFAGGYVLTMVYTSVFYHRGITHKALRLRRWTLKWVVATGNWITMVDPKAWACMHRLHHKYSDKPKDPHSPNNVGVSRVLFQQLISYNRTLDGLRNGEKYYTEIVKDLKFQMNWCDRHGLWYIPHLTLALFCFGVAAAFGWWLGFSLWLAMNSHPFQGWAVNGLAHKWGYRNFNTPDHSTNNQAVALLVFGEGYQNNHHKHPTNPKFSRNKGEYDPGFFFCRVSKALGLIEYKSPARVKRRKAA